MHGPGLTNLVEDSLTAAYPHGEIVNNVSKETTWRELSRIKGVAEVLQRRAGINLTAVRTNAVELAQDILKAPKLDELLEGFMKA